MSEWSTAPQVPTDVWMPCLTAGSKSCSPGRRAGTYMAGGNTPPWERSVPELNKHAAQAGGQEHAWPKGNHTPLGKECVRLEPRQTGTGDWNQGKQALATGTKANRHWRLDFFTRLHGIMMEWRNCNQGPNLDNWQIRRIVLLTGEQNYCLHANHGTLETGTP